MAERGRDQLGWIVLPGSRLEGNDTPALLDDRDGSVAVYRAAGPQVVDRQSDRLRRLGGAELRPPSIILSLRGRS